MKKLLTTIILMCTMVLFGQKEVSMHMYIKVAPEHQEEFERLEMNYWSKVAHQEIKNGNMTRGISSMSQSSRIFDKTVQIGPPRGLRMCLTNANACWTHELVKELSQ